MNYSTILDEIYQQVTPLYGQGQVADYIPELKNVTPNQFAMSLTLLKDNQQYNVGDADCDFSIQSISKVFTLILALKCLGEDLWQRVHVEPSGDPFNSLIQLEIENGLPRNPFINAGAIVISDVLVSNYSDPVNELVNLVRQLSGNPNIEIDSRVAESEKLTGYKNYALANFLKSFGRVENSVEEVLDMYFKQCSIAMSPADLSRSFSLLANQGISANNDTRIITPRQTKRINSIMQTCGFYDQAGEFTFRVGLPGKSGVGGGIAAVMPEHYSLAVWSPQLNSFGNSVLGMKSLELFTTMTGISVF